jgi:hypothetical protein
MSGIEHLLAVAEVYAGAEGIEMKTVSWRALGDGKKLGAIVDGGDIQVRRYEATMQWFSDNWPAGAPWPAAVPRPTPAKAEASS